MTRVWAGVQVEEGNRAAGAHAPSRVDGCGQLYSHAATLRLPLRAAGPRRDGGRAGVQQQPASLAVERVESSYCARE